jgi:hypothetical protein
VNQGLHDLKRISSSAASIPRLQTILDVPPSPPASALRQLAQDAPSPRASDPGALVERAIAVLAEQTAARPVAPTLAARPASPVLTRAPTEAVAAGLALQRPVLSDGTEVPLPIRYFSDQYFAATFLIDIGRATELLCGTGLQALRQEDEKAVVVLVCAEYRITDIGPYNEVGITILSTAPGDPVPAIYVTDLPVTTELANRAGREIWGFNKFVAVIDIESDGKMFSTVVRDRENAMIVTLKGRRGASVPTAPADIFTFTRHNGRLMKTFIQVPTPLNVCSGTDFVLNVGTSGNAMTKTLRSLGLDGASPVLVQHADRFQALLFPGRAV